jgi:hypothetical protein
VCIVIRTRFSFSSLVEVALLVLVICAASTAIVFAAPQPTSGYVQYTITVGGQGSSALPRTFTVNESAQPTSQNGFVAIAMALYSNAMNFSYSRDINYSSLPMIFPYLSGLANQSFSYQMQWISISADIANTGSVQAIFNGTSYQATNYQVSVSATNSTTGKLMSATGNLISMPSGLLYSIKLSINGLNGTTQVNAQLLSTNLPLTAPPTSINPVGASMVGAGVIAAVAIAIPAVLKVKHKNHPDIAPTTEKKKTPQIGGGPESNGEEEPSYWVD